MGDTLKRVKPGDPLAIPAATFNTFVDAAQDFLRRQRGIGRTPVADKPSFETVLLKNASGADPGRFEYLWARLQTATYCRLEASRHDQGHRHGARRRLHRARLRRRRLQPAGNLNDGIDLDDFRTPGIRSELSTGAERTGI
jgi:hypothetical protein